MSPRAGSQLYVDADVLLDVMKRIGSIAWSDASVDGEYAVAIKAALEAAKPSRQGSREGFLVNTAGWGRRERELLRGDVIESLLAELDDDFANGDSGRAKCDERVLGHLPYVRRLRAFQDSL